MKRPVLLISLGLIALIALTSWGFFAHQQINRLAVFTLPTEMIRFYKNNIDYISAHAVDPDKRRYADSAEAPRHYLDADHYGDHPFDSIPVKWQDALKKYGQQTLEKHGLVPWTIERNYYLLVKAFRDRDSMAILKTSAHLGHYIADAHVPLHLTKNYNGQLSDQIGIHAFWESRLPELFSKGYNFYTGKASYIKNPLLEAWKICSNTFSCVDSTLALEKQLHQNFPSDKKYSYEAKGNRVIKTYSETYAKAYHELLEGMVERQMRLSIKAVGNFWYSAWIDAGQPELRNFGKKNPNPEELEIAIQENLRFREGKTLGREEE